MFRIFLFALLRSSLIFFLFIYINFNRSFNVFHNFLARYVQCFLLLFRSQLFDCNRFTFLWLFNSLLFLFVLFQFSKCLVRSFIIFLFLFYFFCLIKIELLYLFWRFFFINFWRLYLFRYVFVCLVVFLCYIEKLKVGVILLNYFLLSFNFRWLFFLLLVKFTCFGSFSFVY